MIGTIFILLYQSLLLNLLKYPSYPPPYNIGGNMNIRNQMSSMIYLSYIGQ